MTSRFQACLQIVLGNEGGYVDNKADRGGRTNFGVTQGTYNTYRIKRGKQYMPVSEIEQDEVEAIYHEYWKDGHCAVIPEPVDLCVFDTAINSGASRAIKLLQRSLGIGEDGLYGPATASAIREEVMIDGAKQLALLYLNERAEFFSRIVERDESQWVFLDGWMNRINHLKELIA